MPETVEVLPFTEAEQSEIINLSNELGCSLKDAERILAEIAFKSGLNRDYESNSKPERLAEIS